MNIRVEGQRFIFETTAERDQFIDLLFPERVCSEIPGLFGLPDGRTVRVFCNEVTING